MAADSGVISMVAEKRQENWMPNVPRLSCYYHSPELRLAWRNSPYPRPLLCTPVRLHVDFGGHVHRPCSAPVLLPLAALREVLKPSKVNPLLIQERVQVHHVR